MQGSSMELIRFPFQIARSLFLCPCLIIICSIETLIILECLDDIEAAMEIFGFPRELEFKLLDRRARALAELGRSKEAASAFDAALEAIERSNLKPDKRRALAQGRNQLTLRVQ